VNWGRGLRIRKPVYRVLLPKSTGRPFRTTPRKSMLLKADRRSEVRRCFRPARRFNRGDPFVGNLNDPVSLHKYLYVHGDPANYLDPTGMFEGSLIGATIGASIRAGLSSMTVSAVFRGFGAGVDLAAGASLRDVALDFAQGVLFDTALGAFLGGGGYALTRAFASNAFKIRAIGQAIGNFPGWRIPGSPWLMTNVFQRGLAIEKAILSRSASFLGRVIQNFPVIDDYVRIGGQGIATSIKSLDMTRKSYQSASGLLSRLRGYAKVLDNFTGVPGGTFPVGIGTPNPMNQKVLCLVFEQGSATSTQVNALLSFLREVPARYPSIKVVVQFIP